LQNAISEHGTINIANAEQRANQLRRKQRFVKLTVRLLIKRTEKLDQFQFPCNFACKFEYRCPVSID